LEDVEFWGSGNVRFGAVDVSGGKEFGNCTCRLIILHKRPKLTWILRIEIKYNPVQRDTITGCCECTMNCVVL
jgi:hypothetical protein